jgi:uncharacterized GH25 family protein
MVELTGDGPAAADPLLSDSDSEHSAQETPMPRRTILALLLVLLPLTPLALAHDFWILPSAFRAPLNTLVKLDLRVGDGYPGEAFPRSSRMFEKFVVAGPDGVERPIVGREGQQPAGLARFSEAGLYVVGYRSRPVPVELDGAKFDQYLRDKGLEKILEAREPEPQAGSKVKEIFSRCAKAIIAAGDPSACGTGFERDLGLRLELLPERNPLDLKPGEAMSLRLLLDGKPAPGCLLIATSPDNSQASPSARTDELGRASLELPSAGVWVISAVEMMPAPGESGADWESLWASLSFEVADAGAPACSAGAPR